MEIVSEWQGKNPDDYRRQHDDRDERMTRASGYADIELSDFPDGGDVVVVPEGGGGKKRRKEEKEREKRERKKEKQARREEGARKRITEPKTVTIQNRELRGFLSLIGILTIFLIIIVLLFMAYPYNDEHNGKGTTYLFVPSLDVPPESLFIGHSNPSTTSYCAAWAGSLLYGGKFAVDGPLSPETLYIIDRYSLPNPDQFSDVYDTQSSFTLVDHNQASQSPPFSYPTSSNLPQIAGIIDTHGVQEDFISSSYELPVSTDSRPWGSTATILYYNLYERHNTPSKALARCLLSSIYSDTVGLEGPTTTDHDRTAASLLTPIASTSSRTQLTVSLIKSRTPPQDTPILDILNIDAKTYHLVWADGTFTAVRWSIYDGENPNFILDRSEEFLEEMRKQKEADSLDFYFLSVVDQLKFFSEGKVENISTLLLPSQNERDAARAIFQGETAREGTEMDVSPKMSRRKEFLPPLDYFFREAQPFQWDIRDTPTD